MPVLKTIGNAIYSNYVWDYMITVISYMIYEMITSHTCNMAKKLILLPIRKNMLKLKDYFKPKSAWGMKNDRLYCRRKTVKWLYFLWYLGPNEWYLIEISFISGFG